MTPFTRRNLVTCGSVILFAFFLYFINGLVPELRSPVQHIDIIAASIIVAICLIIMLFWSLGGILGGLGSSVAAVFFLLRPLWSLDPHYHNVLMAAFFLGSFTGYKINKKISTSFQNYTVTMEKISEDTNLILDHVKNREAEITAIDGKVDSLFKIRELADRLLVYLSDDEIIKIVTESTFDIFGGDNRVLFFLSDTKQKELNLRLSLKGAGRKPVAAKKGDIFDRWVLKNMRSLLVMDVKKDFRFSVDDLAVKDDATSLIIKPMTVKGGILGTLRVDSSRESGFGQHELRILDIIGELVAVALENARLYHQVEELAIMDSLSGLYVHRYFMERLGDDVKRALRSGSSFSVLMMDIDDFKLFNDKHGHVAGDMVIKNIGRILKSNISAGDIAGRYGGEEFVVLALNCGRNEGRELAERIREEINSTPVTLRRDKYYVSVSIGVAIFPEDARLEEDIIGEADKYLYKAKAKGKNIVCSK